MVILWDDIEDNLVFLLGDIFKMQLVLFQNKESHFLCYINCLQSHGIFTKIYYTVENIVSIDLQVGHRLRRFDTRIDFRMEENM